MTGQPAARLNDSIAHTESAFGFGLGGEIGLGVGLALLTVATGGSDLLVLGAIGGAVALTGGGALSGMNIGSTYGETAGSITTGSANVLTNSRPAARTLADVAVCDEHNLPQQIATGSPTVLINSRPAARLGDHTVCDARISTASNNVVIGGGTGTFADISGEVPAIAVTIATDMAIGGTAVALVAGGGAAFAAAGWAGVGVFGLQAGGGVAGGYLGSKAGGAIGTAIDPVHGQAWGQAFGGVVGGAGGGLAAGRLAGGFGGSGSAGQAALSDEQVGGRSFPYSSRNIGQTEPGAVPNTPELQAQIDAGDNVTGRSAPGFPDLPADEARNFGDDVRPWNGDQNPGTIARVIGKDASANGGYWQDGVPADEAAWRGPSAVKNDWNGNGGYVQSPTDGMRGWIGSARPQPSSDGTNVLPGGGQQIWVPPGSAQPGPTMPTPWSGQ